MLDQLRRPFFFLALALVILIVLVELASLALVGLGGAAAAHAAALDAPTPGSGIPYLAMLDGEVLFTTVLIAASLFLPEAVHARLQGIATLVAALLFLLLSLFMLIKAVVLLVLMITLLLAPIFGTIAYFAIYAGFDKGGAAVTLSLLTLLKLGFAACLVLAQQRFLENKGLVAIVATSLVASLVLAFLHGLVPAFLVSITDMIGAIVIAVLALVWALFFLVGSVISIVKAVA